MHHYEFFCHACKTTFSAVRKLAEYEEGEVLCPHCGSNNVELVRVLRHHFQEERLRTKPPAALIRHAENWYTITPFANMGSSSSPQEGGAMGHSSETNPSRSFWRPIFPASLLAWLLLAEGHPDRRRFGAMRIALLPVPTG